MSSISIPESIDELIAATQHEAERQAFPIDEDVYQRAGRDRRVPILFAGALESRLCIVGRDLGKAEVRAGEPLIGAAGRTVRAGILRARSAAQQIHGCRQIPETMLGAALEHALLTNIVPYKPPGNKAYTDEVRDRFRPYLERLLADHWRGTHLITLGTHALQWFGPYGNSEAFRELTSGDNRFQAVYHCQLAARCSRGGSSRKSIAVYPLPHPSPLNRKWYSRFPSMLADRLAEVQSHVERPSP